MKRILAMLTVLMLLCGGALAECPKFSTEEYPRVDGSTATLPLSYALMEAACGVMRGMATFAEAAIQDDYLDEIRAADAFTVEGA